MLAGGAGSRMGGDKAMAVLDGRPLVEHAVAALRAAGLRPVVVAKAATRLPPGLEVWIEPDEPQHPLTGIRFALARAGAGVVTLPVDLLAPPALLRNLAAARGTTVVRGHPLLGVFFEAPVGLGRATEAVAALDPAILEPSGPLADLNTPGSLLAVRPDDRAP